MYNILAVQVHHGGGNLQAGHSHGAQVWKTRGRTALGPEPALHYSILQVTEPPYS